MKKWNTVLNIIIGAFIGTFIGYIVYTVWYYKTNTMLYVMQPNSWYLGILVRGLVTIFVIFICLVIKAVIKRNAISICAAGVFLILLIPVTLTVFGVKNGGGNVDNVYIADWEPSEIYSDEDIEAACQTVIEYFSMEFEGCTLTELYYPGDSYADEFEDLAESINADEAIILKSSFDVDSSGGDGSLNPDSTYHSWMWILTRNDGSEWVHQAHGY